MDSMNIYMRFGAGVLVSLLLSACNKYLDVVPKGYTLLTTVSNYDQWMNDPQLWVPPADLNYLTDAMDIPAIEVPPVAENELLYTWTAQYTNQASFWGLHYSSINSYNSVLKGIDAASGGSEQQKQSLKAEALLGRAYEYLNLINEYGKPYDSATADKDPGVPLVTSDDVAQKVPTRSSVKEVYDFIIADINTAIPNLPPDNGKNRFRGSVAAAYSLLARAYLTARNYDKATENAQLALKNHYGDGMVNYTALSGAAAIPSLSIRPDALYARGGNVADVYTPTLEHLRSFDVHDTRLQFFYSPLGDLSFTTRGETSFYAGGTYFGTTYTNYGTSVPEMKLIIAEVAARSNNLQEALKQLDEIRKNRIPAAYYQPYQSTDQQFVMEKVLDERRFEFPFSALRWFDMRRLDTEGSMPAVQRYDAQGNILSTLQPHSPRYTLQIPLLVLQYNPDMKQNP